MEIKVAIKKLITIYKQEIEYYQELLTLTHQQKQLIADEKFNELEESIAAKGELIEKIDRLENKLQPLKDKLIDQFDLLPETWLLELRDKSNSQELNSLIDRLKEVVNKLSKREKANEKLIKDKKDQLTNEINQVKEGNKVNKSYTKKKRIHSTFIDQKS